MGKLKQKFLIGDTVKLTDKAIKMYTPRTSDVHYKTSSKVDNYIAINGEVLILLKDKICGLWSWKENELEIVRKD